MQTASDLPGVLLISFVFNFRRCFLRSFVPAPICSVTFSVCVCVCAVSVCAVSCLSCLPAIGRAEEIIFMP